MCGIFGYILGSGSPVSADDLKTTLTRLFLLSEARGKEASGLALSNHQRIQVLKAAVPGSQLVKRPDFRRAIQAICADRPPASTAVTTGLAAIGHSRLVTDGCQGLHDNNQPIYRDDIVVVHNGIVVNAPKLWQQFPDLQRQAEVDTEIIPALLSLFLAKGKSIPQAIQQVFSLIEGETSIAVLFAKHNQLLLATNTGSLFAAKESTGQRLWFASERYIVQQALQGAKAEGNPFQVKAGTAALIDLANIAIHPFSLQTTATVQSIQIAPSLAINRTIEDQMALTELARQQVRRCTACILPETMPFIEFDSQGVCNYCRYYEKETMRPESELRERLTKFRRTDGEADCLVAFSGGRDSCYGLHLLKEQYGMTPIAYTYDWGMVTDLGRRNQARVCGKLGVEHIWISADIRAKRENIRKNVEAWMKRPDLGIIPLFMAGDKQFFYYANHTMRQTGHELMVFCSNKLEKTDFKLGFCGIPPYQKDRSQPHTIGKSGKFGLLGYYVGQYLSNPAYFNASIPDTLWAYASYYLMKKDYTYLFDYCPWDEVEINRLLMDEYDWELATDTRTTWRIGDGTAPFYNYIYYTVAGFTEFDTFRSNQIREGVMSRDEALHLVLEENQPRWPSLKEYAQLIRIDFDEFLKVVQGMPKRYEPHR